MILGRICLSLLAIIFVTSLYHGVLTSLYHGVLQREIGRNLLKLLAPFSFGVKARKAELVLPPSLVHLCDFLTILNKSSLMVDQQAL